jgi:hypothetical protein
VRPQKAGGAGDEKAHPATRAPGTSSRGFGPPRAHE